MRPTSDLDTQIVSTADLHCLRALSTCEKIVENQIPNLLRLYLNPWVAQTCIVLNYYTQKLNAADSTTVEDWPAFLANSREEALSGAIKLARFTVNSQSQKARSPNVLLVDPNERFAHFGTTTRNDGSECRLLPGFATCREANRLPMASDETAPGIIILADKDSQSFLQHGLADLWNDPDVITIHCVSASDISLDASQCQNLTTDIVVFDESFVDYDVPVAAFSARKLLFDQWRPPRMSMFHSTTFQPNTLTTMHFMSCVERRDPETIQVLKQDLDRVMNNVAARHDLYRRLYSPSLSKLITLSGFDRAEPTAAGQFISVGPKRIFDGVAGVACSLRGHNPATLAAEIRETLSREVDLPAEVSSCLEKLTGLPFHVPAVSGASAVEHALQIAFSIQPQLPHVLALRGGFSGKTLGSLTGTSREFYKTSIGPLYSEVTYIDPFSESAADDLRKAVAQKPVGVIQLELIQGVGGVRSLLSEVLQTITELRERHSFLLFVDEVQTGMFRTGPFIRSLDVGIRPDLLTIGKGTSDAMFPLAATLYSQRVRNELDRCHSALAPWLKRRFYSASSYATLLNTLKRAEAENWSDRVRRQGEMFQQQLSDEFSDYRNVADVRVFGMLIGIQLKRSGAIRRVLGRNLAKLYSLALLNHPTSPLLMGFCQYEPHIFKLTPGLLMQDDDIRVVTQTIGDVLNRSPLGITFDGLRTIRRNKKL